MSPPLPNGITIQTAQSQQVEKTIPEEDIPSDSLSRSVSEPKSMRRSLSGFIYTSRPGQVHLVGNRMSLSSRHEVEESHDLTGARKMTLTGESKD
jgi:hypothetical protein